VSDAKWQERKTYTETTAHKLAANTTVVGINKLNDPYLSARRPIIMHPIKPAMFVIANCYRRVSTKYTCTIERGRDKPTA